MRYLLLILGSLISTANLHAEALSEEELLLTFDEQMVTIATGGEQSLSRAPAVATVITAKDIEAMGATNLDQVLETVPGLHVSYSSLRLSPIYAIRGIYTNNNPHVLVLVNGVPITQVYEGNRGTLSTLPVRDIARVEVIRGPGSAVYGADAFSGVINVITKTARDIDGTEVNFGVESFDTRRASLLHGGALGNFDLALSVQYYETQGDPDRIIDSDAQSLWDAALGSNASYAPGPLDTRGKRLDTRVDLSRNEWRFRAWNWRQMDTGAGSGVAQALDPTGRADSDNYLTDLTYHNPKLARDLDLKAQLSYMGINTTSEQKLFPPGTILPIGPDGNIDPGSTSFVTFPEGLIGNPAIFERHSRFDLSLFYTGLESQRIRVAGGGIYTNLWSKESKNFGPGVVVGTLTDVTDTPDVFISDHDRTAYYVSLQDEWAMAPDWEFTAGIRHDHYSDFGDTINPRLALVWQPLYNMTAKLLYGRAFRPPSFQELFIQNNPVVQGNPDLKPERIETSEIVIDYQPTFDIHTVLNIYSYNIRDLIEFIPPGGTPGVAENIGRQEGHGFEWEATWELSRTLSLSGNYAYVYTRDKRAASRVANAPHNQVFLAANWRFLPTWNLYTQANWVASRKRFGGLPADHRSNIGDYTTVDLMIRKMKISGHWELAFGIRNLFDEDLREPSPAAPGVTAGSFIPGDYPLAGRALQASIGYRF